MPHRSPCVDRQARCQSASLCYGVSKLLKSEILTTVLRLSVLAHPGSRIERVAAIGTDELGVWVRARPVEGQANAAIERVLAAALRVRPRDVKVVGGPNSRRKIVEVDLPSLDALHARLVASGSRPG